MGRLTPAGSCRGCCVARCSICGRTRRGDSETQHFGAVGRPTCAWSGIQHDRGTAAACWAARSAMRSVHPWSSTAGRTFANSSGRAASVRACSPTGAWLRSPPAQHRLIRFSAAAKPALDTALQPCGRGIADCGSGMCHGIDKLPWAHVFLDHRRASPDGPFILRGVRFAPMKNEGWRLFGIVGCHGPPPSRTTGLARNEPADDGKV